MFSTAPLSSRYNNKMEKKSFVVRYLDRLVLPLAGRVEVLVHLVQQPEQELLRIVLGGTPELTPVAVDHGLRKKGRK